MTRAALRDLAAAVALVALAVGLTWGTWGRPAQWKPDALFYEAQLLEVQGTDAAAARQRVFSGPLAAPRVAAEAAKPPQERTVSSRRWVETSAQFYRRRWVVPALGAALEPLFGTGSLQIVGLLGMVLTGPLLFLFLRLRFSPLVSLAAAATCLALPPLHYWAELPQTDTPGLAAELLALLAAMLALRGGRWALGSWLFAITLLAFTRDSALPVAVAVVWVALRQPSRRTAAMAVGGIVGAALPEVLFGGSLLVSTAYTLNGFQLPAHPSWSFVLHRWPSAVHSLVRHDLSYLLDHAFVAAVVLVGAAGLVLTRRRDPFLTLVRALAVAAAGYLLLLPNYTALRLELVFLPVVAVGLTSAFAVAADAVRRWPAVAPR